MYTNSIITLALGASIVSASAIGQDKSNTAPYFQFPDVLDCPDNGGTKVTRDEVTKFITGPKGELREEHANNLATAHCTGEGFFSTIPLYVYDLPRLAGAIYYAFDPATKYYYLCGTSSGMTESGWPDSCKEINY